MRKILCGALILSSLFLAFPTLAATPQIGPRQTDATATTLKIEWDKVTGAIGYYIYYGTTSGSGTSYEKQYPEFIESTGVTLPNLDAGKTYYVAFTAVDEQGQEGKYSPETVMNTLAAGDASSNLVNFGKLALKTVRVTSPTTLDLTFSNPLDTSSSAQRDFKLVKSGTNSEVIVNNSQVSGNVVSLSLTSPLMTNQKYDLTVITLQDVNKKSIESGVDGISSFTTPVDFSSVNTGVDLNSGGPIVDTPTTQTGDNLTAMQTGTVSQDFSGNMGKNIDIQKTTEVAAQNDKNLPKTGPEALLIVFFSLLLGLGVFYYKRKVS